MNPQLPPFIREYNALYSDLHPADNKQHVSRGALDARISAIKDSLHGLESSTPVGVIPEESVVKILSADEVKDINKLARVALWKESGFLEKIKIILLKIVTAGLYKGIGQIPVQEFTSSVAKYIEYAKQNKLNKICQQLVGAVAEFPEGKLDSFRATGPEKSFRSWRNSRTQEFIVSLATTTGCSHYRCSFDKLLSGMLVLQNINPQKRGDEILVPVNTKELLTLDPKEGAKSIERTLLHELQAVPYGTMRLENMLSKHEVRLEDFGVQTFAALFRKCEKAEIQTQVVAVSRSDGAFMLSTWNPTTHEIVNEEVSVDSSGKVTLAPSNRSFDTVEHFMGVTFNDKSQSIEKVLENIKLGKGPQKIIDRQRDVIISGASALDLLVDPEDVKSLRKEIKEQLLDLDPKAAGGFIATTADRNRFVVVSGGPNGVQEENLLIDNDGSITYKGKRFEHGTTINIILDWDKRPFSTLASARKNLVQVDKKISLEALCEKIRRNDAFYEGDPIQDGEFLTLEARVFDNKAKLAGTWIVGPRDLQPTEGWLAWVVGAAKPFKNCTIWIHDGKGVKRLDVQMNPANARAPFGYMGQTYPTLESLLKAQKPELAALVKPYKAVQEKISAAVTSAKPTAIKPAATKPADVKPTPVQQKPLASLLPQAAKPAAPKAPELKLTTEEPSFFSSLFGAGSAKPAAAPAPTKPVVSAPAPKPSPKPAAAPQAINLPDLTQYQLAVHMKQLGRRWSNAYAALHANVAKLTPAQADVVLRQILADPKTDAYVGNLAARIDTYRDKWTGKQMDVSNITKLKEFMDALRAKANV